MDKKRGQLNVLSGAALAVVVLAIVLVVGFKILGTLSTSQQASTHNISDPGTWTIGYNATQSIMDAMNDNFVGFIPVIIIALVAGIILFIIFKFLKPGQMGGI